MATRSRRPGIDAQGQYARQIGSKRNAQGKQVQHKFRLGADLIEARRQEQRLRELWEAIEAASRNGESLWDDLSGDCTATRQRRYTGRFGSSRE